MSNLLFRPQAGGGSGSGFGGINYIDNPNATQTTTGWVTYADAAGSQPVNGTGGTPSITLTRDTNSLTIGTTSFLITKDAVNRQGEGVSYDFAIDTSIQNKPINISFYCAPSANFTYGSIDGVTPSDITAYVYSIDDSALVGVFPYVITNAGYFTGNFQATSATNYRLILHIGTTNALAWTFAFSEVIVTPTHNLFIQADSDWVSYTPTFTGFGTVSGVDFKYRKQGPNLQIQGKFTSGSSTATEARVSLPSGLTSSNLIPTIQTASGPVSYNNTSASQRHVLIETSKNYLTFSLQGPGAASLTKANGDAWLGSGGAVSFLAVVPIQGWTSGALTAEVVLQNVPAVFSAYKNGGSAFTADTAIPSWTGVHKDSVGAFNSTTGVYTVKIPGDYFVSWTFRQTTSAAGSAAIVVNGTSVRYGVSNASVDSKQVTGVIQNLKVGDTVAVSSSVGATLSSSDNLNVWSMFKIEFPAASMNIPKLITGVARISSAGTASEQKTSFGSTDAWISSVTKNGTGDYTINIVSGIFKDIPKCSFTVEATNASINSGQVKLSTTTAPSSTLIRYTTTNSSGTLTDLAVNVIFVGSNY